MSTSIRAMSKLVNKIKIMTTVTDSLLSPKYPIPKIMVTIFPYECNPLHNTQPMTARAEQWSYESSLLTAAQYRRVEGSSLYTAYFYPFCTDNRRYEVLVKALHNFFILDDHLETPYGDMDRQTAKVDTILGQFYSMLNKLRGDQHVPAHSWKPYILASYAIYDDIIHGMNEIQKHRLLRYWTCLTDSMVAECKHLNDNKRYTNIDEFYQVRDESGFYSIYQLIEYAENLYVPEPEWRNPQLQRLQRLFCRLSVICNDVYSFEKELMDTGGRLDRLNNGVAILARIHGIPIGESMNKLCMMFVELENVAMVLADNIMAAEWASSDTRAFVNNMKYVSGGHWKLLSSLDRYNKLT